MRETNQHNSSPVKVPINLGLEELIDASPVPEPRDLRLLLNQLNTIAEQLENKSLPRALIAEQLIGIRPELVGISQNEPVAQLFDKLRGVLLAVDASFNLRAETREKLLAPVEAKPKVAHRPTPAQVPEQEVPQPVSDIAQFSSLVRSIDEKRKSEQVAVPSEARLTVPRLRISKTYWVAIFLTLLLTLPFIFVRFSRAPDKQITLLPNSQSAVLTKLPEAALTLPLFDPINEVGALSSLAYELQDKQPLPAAERKPQLKTAQADSPQEGRPEQLKIGAQDEPVQIREMQVKPEQKEPENEIDFPPFRSNKPAPLPNTQAPLGGGHAVDRFTIPKSYTAVVPTDIMPRPSYYGQSIGALRSGETILVDALIGPWVRLRLAAGRPGFVLAQDVSAR